MDPVEPWIDGNAVRQMAAQLLSSPGGSEIADSPDAGFGPGFEGFTDRLENSGGNPENSVGAPVPTSLPVADPLARRATPFPELESPDRIVHSPGSVERPAERVVPEAEKTDTSLRPAWKPEPSGDGLVSPGEDSSEDPFQNIPVPAARSDHDASRGPLMERMIRFRDWLCQHGEARSVFVLDRDGQPVLDDPAYAKLHFLARSLSQAYRPVAGQPGNVHVKVGSDAYLVVIPVETAFGCLVLGTVLPRPLDAPSVKIVAQALSDAAKPKRS